MNKITRKSLISTSIFFIFIFLSFSSLYQLFDRPGDVKVWLQCIVASIIASLFQLILHLYHS